MGSERTTTECVNFSCIEGDVLFEVLIRLPVKVLFRFKVVSKQWNSMISDPSFARRYVASASLSPGTQQCILISSFAHKPIVDQFFRENLPLGMNCLDLLSVPRITMAYELRNMLVGISNGLLLYGPAMQDIGSDRIFTYDIYNPMTGRCITLPRHQHCVGLLTFTGFVTQVKDNVLESFRVLNIALDDTFSHGYLRYEVYFSEIREWVYYTADINQDIDFDKWENCAVLDKILHWLVRGRIMAFDLYNKPDSVRLISLPTGSGGGEEDGIGQEYILLDEHQGHLRCSELLRGRSNEFSLSLWKLIDYDTGKWHLQHRVDFDDFRCDGDRRIFLRPLCFHPFGSNIVYMLYREGDLRYILSYDINAREFKTMDDSSENDLSRIPFFFPFFMFVVPPWPVSL